MHCPDLADEIERPLPVDIWLPEHWLGRVRYRLQHDMIVAGYHVPAGFTTDGASVPRILWGVFPPVGRYFIAAVVHDHALVSGRGWSWSNDLFDCTLQALGIRGWRRVCMVAAVRLNGAWQKLRARVGLGGRYVE